MEILLQSEVKSNQTLRKAKLSNQMGTVCLKGEKNSKASELF